MRINFYILTLVICEVAAQGGFLNSKQLLQIADVYEYAEFFKETSDLSVIFALCGGKGKIELVIKSFLYFNTYPIKKMYIAHCSKDLLPFSSILPYGYESHKSFFQIIQSKDQQSGLIQALKRIYQKIDTKYVYQTDGQWVMVKGFGFIQQSIKILKHGSINNIKMAQVTANYPYWRAVAKLTQLQWTQTNQAFHYVIPFNSKKYLHFTMSPSVFEFQNLFQKIMGKSVNRLCQKYECIKQNLKNNFDYDKCCIWAIGQQIHEEAYKQVYINDGTGQPHHQFFVEQSR